MSIFIGIDPSWGHLSYFNATENRTSELQIMKVDAEEIQKIHSMFKEIISHFNGTIKNACICLSPNYGNEIRKKFIQEGLSFGFTNVEIINYSTAIYLNAISQIKFKIFDGNIIWIYRYGYFNVWKIVDKKAKFIGYWEGSASKLNELENIVLESKLDKGPDVVLCDEEIDETKICIISPACRVIAYNDDDYSFSKGSLIKARTSAGDFGEEYFDAIKCLSQKYFIKYGGEKVMNFDFLADLPINVSHELVRKPDCDKIEMIVDDSTKELIQLPNQKVINLIFQIDTNEIYNISFTNNHDETLLTSTFSDIIQSYTVPTIATPIDTKIKAVGIDLGTSRCCAAVNRKNGIVTVNLDNTGERLLPSYVAYDEKSVKCGKIVVHRLRQFSKSTIFDSKRLIGKKFKEIEIDSNWPFGVLEVDGNVILETKKCNVNIKLSAEEVAADLLKYMKQKVEDFQGTKLENVVITAPAAFTEAQKSATIKAAKLAGWQKIHLLPEPIAASFAHFIDQIILENSNVLLFDLGGGTLDVCIFKIENNEIRVISNTGDTKLGGRNFDNVLFNHLKNQLRTKYNIGLMKDKKYKLILECQRIKEDLSAVNSCDLNLDEYDTAQEGTISINREEFESMTKPLLNRIRNTINSALHISKKNPEEINIILLVGGGSRMPMINHLLKDIFPEAQQCVHQNPDEVVAIGAAYYAYSIFSQ